MKYINFELPQKIGSDPFSHLFDWHNTTNIETDQIYKCVNKIHQGCIVRLDALYALQSPRNVSFIAIDLKILIWHYTDYWRKKKWQGCWWEEEVFSPLVRCKSGEKYPPPLDQQRIQVSNLTIHYTTHGIHTVVCSVWGSPPTLVLSTIPRRAAR